MPTEATGRKGSKVLRSGSKLSLSGQVPALYIVYDMGNCQRGKMKHPKYAQQEDRYIFRVKFFQHIHVYMYVNMTYWQMCLKNLDHAKE